MKDDYLQMPYWQRMAALIAAEIDKKVRTEKQFLKSGETRKMLGNISPAKLQAMRISGKLKSIDCDGMYLYDVDDIMEFINKNRVGGQEDTVR